VVHVLIESEKVLTILQQRIKAMEYEKKIIHQAPVRHTCPRDSLIMNVCMIKSA
jgi:hypothetical protein